MRTWIARLGETFSSQTATLKILLGQVQEMVPDEDDVIAEGHPAGRLISRVPNTGRQSRARRCASQDKASGYR